VYLSLTDSISTTQLHRVRAGRLDIAFVHEPPPPDLVRHRVLQEPFGIAVDPRIDADFQGDTCPLQASTGSTSWRTPANQVPIGHDQLVSAAHDAGVVHAGHFANYTENARACLRATGSTPRS